MNEVDIDEVETSLNAAPWEIGWSVGGLCWSSALKDPKYLCGIYPSLEEFKVLGGKDDNEKTDF